MTRECEITGKRRISGNRVSHANNRTKRRFAINIHKCRVYCEKTGKFIVMHITPKGLRNITKLGLEVAMSARTTKKHIITTKIKE